MSRVQSTFSKKGLGKIKERDRAFELNLCQLKKVASAYMWESKKK